jgi:RNA polymerase sigma factor for flagellar operon FliA
MIAQTDGARTNGQALSDDEVADLWQAYCTERTDDLRNTLMEHYLPLVKYQADRASARLPAEVDPDDVYAAGILGLRSAIESFEPGRGVKFETYGAARVHGAIIDSLRRRDWVPRSVRRRNRRLDTARQTLASILGHEPSDADMADHLEMSPDDYHRFVCRAEPVQVASLDNTVPGGEDGHDATWSDLVAPQDDEGPDRQALREDLKAMLTRHLSRKERLVLVLYYYEQMTMKEIAAALDLSETRICQIHTSIIDRLRDSMKDREEEFRLE